MSHFLIPKGGEAAQSCVLSVWTGWANINTDFQPGARSALDIEQMLCTKGVMLGICYSEFTLDCCRVIYCESPMRNQTERK